MQITETHALVVWAVAREIWGYMSSRRLGTDEARKSLDATLDKTLATQKDLLALEVRLREASEAERAKMQRDIDDMRDDLGAVTLGAIVDRAVLGLAARELRSNPEKLLDALAECGLDSELRQEVRERFEKYFPARDAEHGRPAKGEIP